MLRGKAGRLKAGAIEGWIDEARARAASGKVKRRRKAG